MNDTARPAAADRPIPELIKDLTDEMKALVRDELELVRLEVAKKGKKAGESAGYFGATTLLGLGAFFALTITLIAALAHLVPIWLSALIVTIAYGAGAAFSALRGKQRLEEVAALPSHSAQSVKRDVAAVRAGVERGR